MFLWVTLYAGVLRNDIKTEPETPYQESIRRATLEFKSVCSIKTLVTYKDHKKLVIIGTGILIKPNVVLTAAHVVKRQNQIQSDQIKSIKYFITVHHKTKEASFHPDLCCDEVTIEHHPSWEAHYDDNLVMDGHSGYDLAKIILHKPINNVEILPLIECEDELKRGSMALMPCFGPLYLQDGSPLHGHDNLQKHLLIKEITNSGNNLLFKNEYGIIKTEAVRSPSIKDYQFFSVSEDHKLFGNNIPGDSGSPLIVECNGRKKIAGILCSVESIFSGGNYSQISHFTSLQNPSIRQWIDS